MSRRLLLLPLFLLAFACPAFAASQVSSLKSVESRQLRGLWPHQGTIAFFEARPWLLNHGRPRNRARAWRAVRVAQAHIRWRERELRETRARIWRALHPPVVAGGYGVALCGASCVRCESGGDPGAWSPDGKYWGLYQFDYGTWVAHGGSPGSYGRASGAEQTAVAARMSYDGWPNC